MRSNKLSSYLGFTTFGESHGPALGLVIEDIKPNLDFPYDELNSLLAQRRPDSNPYSTERKETDEYQVVSGVFEGKTTGMPICILFWNKDARPEDYAHLKDVFRPGHADFAWYNKFKLYDYRGGGRASGRETISRVAASAFVSNYIKPMTIKFQSSQIGTLKAENQTDFCSIDASNPFCWADSEQTAKLYDYLNQIKRENDTVGGIVKVRIDDVPIGLGDPVFEKLNANLAKAIMSIGTVKGVSFGSGFDLAAMKGSESNDQMDEDGFLSNHTGGVAGGISTGQPIIINVAIKPISSHGKPQQTIDKDGKSTSIEVSGRHDVCHIPRLIPVIEAMIKLTLADALAWQKQISGVDFKLSDYREMVDKIDEDILLLLQRRNSVVSLVKDFKNKHNLPCRDIARELELTSRWCEIARELNLPESKSVDLLNSILEICRNDHSLDTL